MTWRLWWPHANKIIQRQSSSRHGWFKRIGAGIVRRLAADGASVAFTYSSSKEKALQLISEIESTGGKALSLKADSASAEELAAAVGQNNGSLRHADISSATRHSHRGTIDTYTLEDFDRMVPSTSVPPSSVFRRLPNK